jgi:hypothetical protein
MLRGIVLLHRHRLTQQIGDSRELDKIFDSLHTWHEIVLY